MWSAVLPVFGVVSLKNLRDDDRYSKPRWTKLGGQELPASSLTSGPKTNDLKNVETYRQTYRQPDIQTDIQTDRQTARQTYRQPYRQTRPASSIPSSSLLSKTYFRPHAFKSMSITLAMI
ncbi:hypothetical protein J6590_018792 [Homalodisca vitripennis]|nr:hypothetical protein J6590_018792 [Homalodisca vitripennis]